MIEYVKKSLFVYSVKGAEFRDRVEQNPHGVFVTSMPIPSLAKVSDSTFADTEHIVVSGSLTDIKTVFRLAHEHDVSVGILPLQNQKDIIERYQIPEDSDEAISLALQKNAQPIDLVLCNGHILLFKCRAGMLPLVDSDENEGWAKVFIKSIKHLLSLRLVPLTISTYGSKNYTISTAASGFMVFENPEKSFATGLIAHEFSMADEMVSMLIVSPFSIIAYLQLMIQRLTTSGSIKRIPDSIGFIKSPHIKIESKHTLETVIDGELCISTPIECRVLSGGVRVNHRLILNQAAGSTRVKEKIRAHSLPIGKELLKTRNKGVPFFTYASEDRFKDLFTALRGDGNIDSKYIVLMLLSTILATIGLYLNSSSVIIGAMLLAPLMAPLISMAMSLLRYEKKLFRKSFWKVSSGVIIALAVGAIFTLISPYQPFTAEMRARFESNRS